MNQPRTAEVIRDGRHPRRSDAHDIAWLTRLMLDRFTTRIALYILPDGKVVRMQNPCMVDPEAVDSCVGVYDASSSEQAIVDDILAMET